MGAGLGAFVFFLFLLGVVLEVQLFGIDARRKKSANEKGFFCCQARVLEPKRGESPRTRGMELWILIFMNMRRLVGSLFILGEFWICTGDYQGLCTRGFSRSRMRLTPAGPASRLRHFDQGSDASHPLLREISPSGLTARLFARHKKSRGPPSR